MPPELRTSSGGSATRQNAWPGGRLMKDQASEATGEDMNHWEGRRGDNGRWAAAQPWCVCMKPDARLQASSLPVTEPHGFGAHGVVQASLASRRSDGDWPSNGLRLSMGLLQAQYFIWTDRPGDGSAFLDDEEYGIV